MDIVKLAGAVLISGWMSVSALAGAKQPCEVVAGQLALREAAGELTSLEALESTSLRLTKVELLDHKDPVLQPEEATYRAQVRFDGNQAEDVSYRVYLYEPGGKRYRCEVSR